MNGERPTANGDRSSIGFQQGDLTSASHAGLLKQAPLAPPPSATPADHGQVYANGDVTASHPLNGGGLGQEAPLAMEHAPQEILQLIPKDNYLPMAALISRASQSCWNGLSDLVEQLAAIQVHEQPPEQVKTLVNGLPNNQTKANLDKKERLLKYANDQKADFIKLLVLLQWSKNVDEVSKTININYWLMKRREAYWQSIAMMSLLKQESSAFQIPNPDLKTAAEVLSTHRVLGFPRLGYVPQRDLSNQQVLQVLNALNRSLSVKLALSTDIPLPLRRYRVHDGRATFTVPNEFELDVSILDEDVDTQFRVVDFRFSFQPSPPIPDTLHAEFERYANANIDREGLQGCYDFLHEMALSYKLAEFHKQAVSLSRSQWAGNLRVEFIRRNLIVQYWTERPFGKSWIQFGVASGREKRNGTGFDSTPFLDIKWMRQGKLVEHFDLAREDAVVSFESILRQVIAQHATHVLDSFYDKLVLTPLFADGELNLEQSVSYRDPDECSLVMQVSGSAQLDLKVDSVTGVLVLSPVTERSERLQYEINRISGVADEVVSKLLNFRCIVMEATILAGVLGTSWEILRAFKFSQAEIKGLFGAPVVRMNMFRQQPWALDYALAVTHTQHGDHWWLLQSTPSKQDPSQTQYRVLRHQPIEVTETLSPAFFDRLADYSMGLISLQKGADFFKDRREKYELGSFPTFDLRYKLPELSFELDLARPSFAAKPSLALPDSVLPSAPASHSDTTPKSGNMQRQIRVRFGGVDRAANTVKTIAQYRIRAKSSVLRQLDKSILGTDIILNPEDRMITIRVQTSMSEAAIPVVLERALDLEKIVSTVEQIHGLPGFKLRAISRSAFTVLYDSGPPTELALTVTFGQGTQEPRLQFLPPDENPHKFLTSQYTRLFASSRAPYATKIRDFLTSLTVTLPLLKYLASLQLKHSLDMPTSPASTSAKREDYLRVHVLARNATAFAVQYFTPPGRAPRDVRTESQPHLLARLEIMQHVNASRKAMWLVRAALEDFQSYSRPSYSSPALRSKLNQEVFTRIDGQAKWLALDKAAVCMADQPEPLLQALHDLLWEWAKQSTESESEAKEFSITSADQETANNNAKGSANNANKKPTIPSKGPGKAAATNNTLPNGGVKGARPPNAPNAGGRATGPPNKANAKAPVKNKEIITLD